MIQFIYAFLFGLLRKMHSILVRKRRKEKPRQLNFDDGFVVHGTGGKGRCGRKLQSESGDAKCQPRTFPISGAARSLCGQD
jgi:hypothetical protein